MKKLVSTDFSAENWLILGKKWSMMIATADKYGCRTLPMRNWHMKNEWYHLKMDNSSDITYEELTLLFSSSYVILKLYILSDITYEELTPFARALMAPKILMSDITYEELTRNCNFF